MPGAEADAAALEVEAVDVRLPAQGAGRSACLEDYVVDNMTVSVFA